MDRIKNAKVAIFSTTALAKNLKDVIQNSHLNVQVKCFIDSFSEEDSFCGLPIVRPNAISEDIDWVIVASKSHREKLVSVLEANNWTRYIVPSDDILDLVTMVYVAYWCANYSITDKLYTEEDFYDLVDFDAGELSRVFTALTQPKKK